MDRSNIALVGASCRAMAASLAASGYRVATADMFADLDTRGIAAASTLRSYPWSAAAWLASESVDAWCYTGGFENYPRLLARMARVRPLLGNAPETLRLVRDPLFLADLARRRGYLFPEISTAARPSEAGAWLVKAFRSGGGLHVQREGSVTLVSQRNYRQRWTAGIPMSLAILSTPKAWRIVGACRLHNGPAWGTEGEFVFAGGITVPLAELACLAELEGIVAALHEEARSRSPGLIGLWGIDFLLADRPVLLEVNPRWTATIPLHERTLNTRLMPRHILAYQTSALDELTPLGDRVSGLQIVYASRPVVFTQELLGELSAQFDLSREASLGRPVLADIPNVGTPIETGHPICSLYADGSDQAEVERGLASQVATVRRILQQGNGR